MNDAPPYDHEMRRLERLLESAAEKLGSADKGSRAQAARNVGVAQEVLRQLNYRMWNEHAALSRATGTGSPQEASTEGNGSAQETHND